DAAATRAGGTDAARLRRLAAAVRGRNGLRPAKSEALAGLMQKHSDSSLATCSPRTPRVLVERERARFSARYELLPRAASPAPRPGHAGRLAPPGQGRPPAGDGDLARRRLPVLAGPPLRQGAPGLVPAAPGRVDPLRREPAQEIPGHLPLQLREPRLARALGR